MKRKRKGIFESDLYLLPHLYDGVVVTTFYGELLWSLMHLWYIYYNGLGWLTMMLVSTLTKVVNMIVCCVQALGSSLTKWCSNSIAVTYCKLVHKLCFFLCCWWWHVKLWKCLWWWGALAYGLRMKLVLSCWWRYSNPTLLTYKKVTLREKDFGHPKYVIQNEEKKVKE